MNTLLLSQALAQPSPKRARLRGVRPGAAPPNTPEESPAWDERSLRQLVRSRLSGAQIIVVSNRQPHSHHRQGGQVRIEQAASGLVTAIEPVVRACGGSWIAHGSGNADRDHVDATDSWTTSPASGQYRLRRVWLSAEQQRGHGDGLSNSGLWPLCHLAHVRPLFRQPDWQHYVEVNRLFADAVLHEAQQPDPVLLVQDYHLALLPAMVRQRLPQATVLSFWHIPWTHPAQMSQCPWLAELVDGLLGSDVVGFQTARHADHFFASARGLGRAVKRNLGPFQTGRCRVSAVRDYAISIAWPGARAASAARVWSASMAPGAPAAPRLAPLSPGWRQSAAQRWGVPAEAKLIVGVDRLDPSKGLIERLHAVEALLQQQPQWQGRLRFVQVAAPTRTGVAGYAELHAQVRAEVQRINARFGVGRCPPILLLDQHHDRDSLDLLYRAADLCLVTSLHDGMNLVCKEFVAARDDEQGVLVLSQFAGAAHELTQALLVNPYHITQVAQAMHQGLAMPADEQAQRMRALRSTVKSNNVFRWGARMLLDAAAVRDGRAGFGLAGGKLRSAGRP